MKIKATLKPLHECYEINNNLNYIPESAFIEASKVSEIEVNVTMPYFCYTTINCWEYPLSFFNIELMWIFNKQGKLNGR
jgi:hypothetical protein